LIGDQLLALSCRRKYDHKNNIHKKRCDNGCNGAQRNIFRRIFQIAGHINAGKYATDGRKIDTQDGKERVDRYKGWCVVHRREIWIKIVAQHCLVISPKTYAIFG